MGGRLILPFVTVCPLLLFSYLIRSAPLTALESLRFEAARLILLGKRPYLDFWDWSQPLAYLLSLPLAAFSPDFVTLTRQAHLCQLLLLVASAALSVLLMRHYKPDTRYWPLPWALLFAFLTAALVCYRQAGDLQFAFMLTLFPWLLMRFFTLENVPVAKSLQLVAILAVALGAALDAPFVLIVLCGELYFWLTYGQRAFAFKQYLQFFSFQIVQLTACAWLFRECVTPFQQWIMPMRLSKFFFFDNALLGRTYPDNSQFIYIFALVMAMSYYLCQFNANLGHLLGLVASICLAGFALYMLEGEGLSSDFVIAPFMLTLLTVLCFFALMRLWSPRRKLYRGIVTTACIAALWPAAMALNAPLARGFASNSQMAEVNAQEMIVNLSRPGDRIAIFAQYPDCAYPLLPSLERRSGNYLLWSRPMRMLSDFQYQQPLHQHMFDFQSFLLNKVARDIVSTDASLILVEQKRQAALMRWTQLDKVLQAKYRQSGTCAMATEPYGVSYFTVWQHK